VVAEVGGEADSDAFIRSEMLRPATALRKLSERLPKRDDPKRFWMHLPLGVGITLGVLVSPVAAVMCFVSFIAYETLEDWRIGDHSYIDIAGYMAGACLGLGILAVVALFTNFWESIPL